MRAREHRRTHAGDNTTLPPTSKPAPPTTKAPAKAPTLVPYIPSDDDVTPKPYIPSDSKKSTQPKSKSHWFRNLVLLGLLGGGCYYVYKRRFLDSFNFMQYRRVRNFGNFGYDNGGGDDSAGMYTNLNASTTFEPPSLPPTPQMMGGDDGGMMMGGHMMQNFGGNQMS